MSIIDAEEIALDATMRALSAIQYAIDGDDDLLAEVLLDGQSLSVAVALAHITAAALEQHTDAPDRWLTARRVKALGLRGGK